jgi:CRISPR-associated protein Csm1
MIILGDVSGIQRYLFDVSDAGGGQARRLRARSFYIQLLTEAAVLRALRTLLWPLDDEHFLLSDGGKFLLKGAAGKNAEQKLLALQQESADWLLRETRGELRLTLGWADGDGDIGEYRKAMAALQRAKLRPWAPAATRVWDPASLVLLPLDLPCSLCGHATAVEPKTDEETGELRRVCRQCGADKRLGRQLPRARWLGDRDGYLPVSPRSQDRRQQLARVLQRFFRRPSSFHNSGEVRQTGGEIAILLRYDLDIMPSPR